MTSTSTVDFKALLLEWRLGEYIQCFEDEGYDSVSDWPNLEVSDLVQDLGMKKGRARRFIRNVKERQLQFKQKSLVPKQNKEQVHASNTNVNVNGIITIKVYINKDFLKKQNFTTSKDVCQLISIPKTENGYYFRYLQQQIPRLFQQSFSDVFNNKQYSWYILCNDTSGSLMKDENDLSNELEIYEEILELRVIFQKVEGNAPPTSHFDDISNETEGKIIFESKTDADEITEEVNNEYKREQIIVMCEPEPEPEVAFKLPDFSLCKNKKPADWYTRPNKTIVFLGETGTGKTTTINSMVNYLYKIKKTDNFRCKLIHEKSTNITNSQTSDVNMYYLQSPPGLAYNLTVIDTPGYGDTRGAKVAKLNSNTIEHLFKKRIKELNMICFVIRASSLRLTEPQEDIFNQIFELFSKDIKHNIYILFTWSSTYAEPQAVHAVKQLPYTAYFKINNGAFFLPAEGSTEEWNLTMKEFGKMFDALHTVPATSLVMLKKVLQRKNQLLTEIDAIQPKIKNILQEMQNIKVMMNTVMNSANAVNAPNSTISFTEPKLVKYEKSVSYTSLVCDGCKQTCCKNCTHWSRATCGAMTWGGGCRICSSSCSSTHNSEKYIYDTKWENVKVTGDELAERYKLQLDQIIEQGESVFKLSKTETIIEGLIKKVDKCQSSFYSMANDVRQCIFELSEIALRPQVLTLEKYIDQMIEDEKKITKIGWRKRVSLLEQLKLKGNQMNSNNNSSFFPSKELRDLKKSVSKKRNKISGYMK